MNGQNGNAVSCFLSPCGRVSFSVPNSDLLGGEDFALNESALDGLQSRGTSVGECKNLSIISYRSLLSDGRSKGFSGKVTFSVFSFCPSAMDYYS
jgi:hypothetical protein